MRTLGFLNTLRRNRNGREERPRFLTWTVTFKCNARCVMCDSWKIRSADDLTPDEAEAIFSQLPQLDVVRLTGGEPFVRRDFPKLVELATRHLDPLALQITSNGFLTDEMVRFCEERRSRVPLHLLISVDGVGRKHDQVRGRSDAWERTIATVRALAPRQRELGIQLAVNQTIVDREGIDHYAELRDLLAPLGVNNQMVLAYDMSATYSVERDLEVQQEENRFRPYGSFTTNDLRELIDMVEADLPRYSWKERLAKRYYLDGLRSRVLGEGAGPNPKCVALHGHLRLFPNGDVPTCQFNSKIVGNLRSQSFEEVWNGVKATEQRKWVRACKGCWAECEVVPNAVYTGDLAKHVLKGRSLRPKTPRERNTVHA